MMDATFYLTLLSLAQAAEMKRSGCNEPPDTSVVLARANAYAQFCAQAEDDGGAAHEPYDGADDELEQERHEIQTAIWRRDRQREMKDTQRRGDSDG